jgi:hypothetical protein
MRVEKKKLLFLFLQESMSDTSNIACLSDVKRSGVLKLKRLTYVCRVARPIHIVHNVTLTYNPHLTPLLQFIVEFFKLEGVSYAVLWFSLIDCWWSHFSV